MLQLAYEYALKNGLAHLSLRPVAAAVGSSPRVLLYLFGSKDGLVRALLARLAPTSWRFWIAYFTKAKGAPAAWWPPASTSGPGSPPRTTARC